MRRNGMEFKARAWIASLAALGALAFALPATPVALALAPRPKLVWTFSCRPAKPCGSFTSWSPGRLAVDESAGRVYVLDPQNDAVEVFDLAGVYQSQILGSGTAAGSLDYSGYDDDIAVDNSSDPAKGNVYVLGEGGLLSAFDSSDEALWQTPAPARPEWPPTDWCGVAVDGAGGVWAADYFRGVQQYDPASGSPMGAEAAAGPEPCHLTFAASGNLLMTSWKGNVTEYQLAAGPSLVAVKPLDAAGSNDQAVTVDRSNGDVYVARPSSIAQFDESGEPVIGTPFGWASITSAVGVAVDGAAHKIFVSDNGAKEVLEYDAVLRGVLTVTPEGNGSGSVSADSAPIAGCSQSGGVCSGQYGERKTVTLTATPDVSSSFVGWEGGGCSGTASTCEVTLNGVETVIRAKFALNQPTVQTGGASQVTQTGAELNGTVNPNGSNVSDCRFEYGTSLLYGSQAPCVSAPGGSVAPVAVTATLAGLPPGTEYHYRLVAGSAAGTSEGQDSTFKTQSSPALPPARVEAPVAKPAQQPVQKPAVKKALTRAQLLSRALKRCRKLPKHKRAACMKQARKRYAPPRKRKGK